MATRIQKYAQSYLMLKNAEICFPDWLKILNIMDALMILSTFLEVCKLFFAVLCLFILYYADNWYDIATKNTGIFKEVFKAAIPEAEITTFDMYPLVSSISCLLPLLTSTYRFSLLDSCFSLLASRFLLSASRFSLLASRFSILDSRFSLLASHFSLLFPIIISHSLLLFPFFFFVYCFWSSKAIKRQQRTWGKTVERTMTASFKEFRATLYCFLKSSWVRIWYVKIVALFIYLTLSCSTIIQLLIRLYKKLNCVTSK